MKISTIEAVDKFEEILAHVQEQGREVEIFQGQKVVAVISPVGKQGHSEQSRQEANHEYRTWGETLSELK